jgi:hypothetical protein
MAMKKSLILIVAVSAIIAAGLLPHGSRLPIAATRLPSRTSLLSSNTAAREQETVATLAAVPTSSDMETLSRAFQTGDPAWPRLREDLANQLREDPDNLIVVIEFLKSETNPPFSKFLAEVVMQNSGSSGHALLREAALGMAEDEFSPEQRQAALAILAAIENPELDLVQLVGQMAQSDTDARVKLGAVDTLGTWLRSAPEMADDISMELIEFIRSAGSDEAVRAHGFQALTMQEERLSGKVLQAIPDLLQKESSPQNRALAATVLGRAGEDEKAFALGQLERAYQKESDTKTRQAIGTQMIRLGKTEALERLKKLSADDPLLVKAWEDYLQTVELHGAKPLPR